MSRWLSSVNNLLEKLDDHAEIVADETADNTGAVVARSAAALAGRFLGNNNNNNGGGGSSGSEEYDDEYLDSADEESYYEDEDDEEEYSDEQGQEEEVEFQENQVELNMEKDPDESEVSEPLFDDDRVADKIQEKEKLLDAVPVAIETAAVSLPKLLNDGNHDGKTVELEQTPPAERERKPEPARGELAPPEIVMKDAATKATTAAPITPAVAVEKPKAPPPPPRPEPPVPTSAPLPPPTTDTLTTTATTTRSKKDIPQPPSSNNSNSQQQQSKRSQQQQRDLKKATQDATKYQKLASTLQQQLDAAQTEMQAQMDELAAAAVKMQEDRAIQQEEREDLMDDHDDQVQALKDDYLQQLAQQEERYEQEQADLQARVQQEEQKRMREGGDWTKELEDALEREREVLKRLAEMQTTLSDTQQAKSELEMQQEALQSKVESLTDSSKSAADREREAEDKLDASMSAHKRQLNQRQAREAELERTVAELGAALTVAQQRDGRKTRASVGEETAEVSYKDQYEVAAEELETVRTQLSLAAQRCEALQQEQQDVSKERIAETAVVQERQRGHDGKVELLTTKVSQLEASLRKFQPGNDIGTAPDSTTDASSDHDRARQLTRELDRSKRQIASLSDQLIRQQGSTETAKSEILALKGRLQASNARADTAEQANASAANPDERMYEMEGGGVTYTASKLRRRVKSGRGPRSNNLPARSVRSALGLRLSGGPGMEQVALTIDAVDSWMLDTGTVLRLEPLARVAFAAYLTVLHLWCFTLVFFHAVESEHGDLGSLTIPRADHQPLGMPSP